MLKHQLECFTQDNQRLIKIVIKQCLSLQQKKMIGYYKFQMDMGRMDTKWHNSYKRHYQILLKNRLCKHPTIMIETSNIKFNI